jgi:hypothetical protein
LRFLSGIRVCMGFEYEAWSAVNGTGHGTDA